MSNQPPSGFQPSHRQTPSADLALQYSQDMNRITRSLFRETTPEGKKIKRYLSHVRIIEDSRSPSSRPPLNSPQSNKKPRLLILSVKESGRIELHKAKDSNGIIQIGRTWDFDELTQIELDQQVSTGFIVTMGKQYYWETNSPKERRVWLTSLLEKYIKYTNGKIPNLVNCDVNYFHLEDLYNQLQHSGGTNNSNQSYEPSARSVQSNNTASTHTPTDVLSHSKRLQSPTKLNTNSFEDQERSRKAAAVAAAAAETIRKEKLLEEEKIRQQNLLKQRELEEKERQRQLQDEELQRQRQLEQENLERQKQEEELQRQREFEAAAANTTNNTTQQFSYDITNEDDIDGSYVDDLMDDYGDDSQEEGLNLGSTAPLNFGSSATIEPPKLYINGNDTLDEELNAAAGFNQDDNDEFALNKQLEGLITGIADPLQLKPAVIQLDEGDNRPRSRSRALSRVHEDENQPNDDEFMELLEEVGYDPLVDDASSLEKKMLAHLEKLQFKKIESLTGSNDIIKSLERNVYNSINQCDDIDPQFNLFTVQLSSFKDDVDFIENQGHGIQVLTTNKKLLKNELYEIVHSVDISDAEIEQLVTNDYKLGFENNVFEKTLGELFFALQKIKGGNKGDMNERNSQLSNMAALKEKKSKFESTNLRFIQSLKSSTSKIFLQVSASLSNKLTQVKYEDFESQFIKVTFLERLSFLLTLSGFIAYVKEVSEKDYLEIIEHFKEAFRSFFDNLVSYMIKQLKEKMKDIQLSKFSFILSPKDLLNETYYALKDSRNKDKGVSSHINSGQKILEELGLKSQNSASTKELEKASIANNELKTSHITEDFCNQIVLILSMQQELVTQLFSMSSSSDYLFINLIKTPLEKRCKSFLQKASYFNDNKETDRTISDSIFEIMKYLFETTFALSLKTFSEVSRSDILQTPSCLFILKDFQNHVKSTNQEYIYSMFTKLDIKLSSIWDREIDEQIKLINSKDLSCKVMEYTKAYTVFFTEIQAIIDTLEFDQRPIFGTNTQMNGNFEIMWHSINSALTKGLGLRDEKAGTPEDENELNLVIQKHLSLLVNYKWLYEETKILVDFPKTIYKEINDARTNEMRLFTNALALRHDIGKLSSLTNELEMIVESGTNPAITMKHSPKLIEEILLLFREDEFHRTIRELSADVSNCIRGTCCNVEDKSNESKSSIEIGLQMEKEMYNNCMTSLSQLYISVMGKLTPILENYYTTIPPPFDRSNVNYYFKKTYL